MGVKSFFQRVFFPESIEQRSTGEYIPVGSLTSSSLLDALNLNSGTVHVGPETALKLATVFRCVDLLSSTAAAMPWELFRKTGNVRESATNHPNYFLYKFRPHPLQTSFIWRKTLFAHALLWGNAYAKITRNGIQRPVSMKIYHPKLVSVTEYNDELYYSFDGGPLVTSSDVIHFKLFSLDGLTGRSIIRMAAESMSVPMQAQRFTNSFLEKGARVSGVLTHPGKMQIPAKQQLAKDWREVYGGSANAGGTPILDEGVKYEKIGMSPADFQLLNMMNVSDKTICTWFGVPQHLAGLLDHATFSNIEHQDLEYVKYSLLPHIVNFEQEVDYKTLRLAELGEFYTKVNLNALLRADIKTRFEAYRTAIQNGFMSPNMAAELEEWNPAEGGDQRFIQQNMMPIDKVDQVLSSQSSNSSNANPASNRNVNPSLLNGFNGNTVGYS